jgi:hypothetical protein
MVATVYDIAMTAVVNMQAPLITYKALMQLLPCRLPKVHPLPSEANDLGLP